MLLSIAMPEGLCACGSKNEEAAVSDKAYIDEALNLANNENQEWRNNEGADATSGAVKCSLVIGCGKEDHVFGNREQDARH